jgi:VanZ family protein
LTKLGPDKLLHALEFGILAFLAANALLTLPRFAGGETDRWKLWLLAVLLTALWGTLDEVHQLWVPMRSSDILDALADILGGMVGAWLLLYRVGPGRRITEAVDGKP